MYIPLLKTKLNMPVLRESIVRRPRLIEKLNTDLEAGDGFSRKLTLISAPAGYGKTTVAIKWLAGLEPKALWLSLEEEDNDPVRFMAYLVAAFQQADENIGIRSLEMLQSPQPPQAEAFTTYLINDLSQNPAPLILALDDYHYIQNPMIHQLVSFLLEHQPAHLHQVIMTREDPLLPVSRLLSRSQARELRQDDLRFTAAETTDFLKRTMGLNLIEEDMRALQRRTEGWIAGLQLAALSMQGQADVHSFIEYFSGSNRYILDYLFEEVFAQQTTEVQEFLMRTSILNQLRIDLCDYVVEQSDSSKLLKSLERANLFILPMDPAREWYRYHRLFRDLLRHRMRVRQGEEEAQLHLRACDWYQAHGMKSDAVQHALSAGDWDRASELVLDASELMMKEGKIVTLLGWFKQFPDSFVRANPGLAIDYIWTLILTGQTGPARSLLEDIETSIGDDADLLSSVISARAYLARAEGDVPGTIEYSQRALELVPESNVSLRSILAINLGIAHWHTGQMEQASQALDEAMCTAQETGNYYALLAALIFLGRVEAVRGNLQKAEELFRQAIKYGISAPLTGLAHIDLGALQYEWNNLDASRVNLLKGVEINEAGANFEYQVAGNMLLARLDNALGNTESANEYLEKLQELEGSQEVLPPNRARSQSLRAEIALQRGDLTAAQQLAAQMEMDVDAHPFYRFYGLIQERILIAEGKKKDAAALLTPKLKTAKSAGWSYGIIAVQVLQALTVEDQEAAVGILTEALERTHEEGFIRIYADSGRDLSPLLLEAAQRGVYPEYIGQILAGIRDKPGRETSIESQVERLSERELEVLRLVSAGLSNREIAAQLFLSPGTIKTHIHNICGKLGASNRTQAVTLAQDLELI